MLLLFCSYSLSSLVEQYDPGANEMTMVMIGSTANEIAVNDARLVDENAATNLQVKSTLGHSRHATSFYASSGCGDFDAVAYGGNGFIGFKEVLRDADEVPVVTEILRGSAAGEENAEVLVRIDILESDVGLDGVAFELAGDMTVPVGGNFMKDHVVATFFGTGDNGLEAFFDQAIVRIQGVDGFGCFADNNEYFVHKALRLKYDAESYVVSVSARHCSR